MPAKKPYPSKPKAKRLAERDAPLSPESLLKKAANVYSREHNIPKLERIAQELAFKDREASKHIYKRCGDLYERDSKLRNAARCFEMADDFSSARRIYLELNDKVKAELVWRQLLIQKSVERAKARKKP